MRWGGQGDADERVPATRVCLLLLLPCCCFVCVCARVFGVCVVVVGVRGWHLLVCVRRGTGLLL